MKKLSDTYKELGIAFTFPIEIKEANGNQTYFEDSNGYWHRQEWDDNVRATYYEDSYDYWERFERDAKGRPTYYENNDGYWEKWERDDNGDVDYWEDSTGVNKGTPKAVITLDREETILFADILKAASTPPTPEFKRALRAYRDFIIKHKQ